MAEQFGKFINGIDLGNEGDGIDKLHFGRAPLVSMFCSAFLLLMKYMQIKPILCWVPYEFVNEQWIEYATYFCYVSNTFIPDNRDMFGKGVLKEIEAGRVTYLMYYQWVPLIFIAVAMVFYLPRLLWQGILESEGINITAMVKSVNGFENALKVSERSKKIDGLARYMRVHFMERKLKSASPLKKVLGKVCCISRSDTSYIGRMYLMLKVIQVCVAFGMLFFLNFWLDGYHFYGIDVLYSAFTGTYNQTQQFPLLSFCEMDKRALGDMKDYRFQCLLTMNLFNEKIFVLFWFFLVYVALVTLLNAIGWFVRVLTPGNRAAYIRSILSASTTAKIDLRDNEDDKEKFNRFVNKFLKPDGVFTFRLINANTHRLIMHEILGKLWNLFVEEERKKELKNISADKPPNEKESKA